VRVSFPQLDVPDLLDLDDVVTDKNATGMTLKKFYFIFRILTGLNILLFSLTLSLSLSLSHTHTYTHFIF
jgi:hypothetical protein